MSIVTNQGKITIHYNVTYPLDLNRQENKNQQRSKPHNTYLDDTCKNMFGKTLASESKENPVRGPHFKDPTDYLNTN